MTETDLKHLNDRSYLENQVQQILTPKILTFPENIQLLTKRRSLSLIENCPMVKKETSMQVLLLIIQ